MSENIKIKKTPTGKYTLKLSKSLAFDLERALEVQSAVMSQENEFNRFKTIGEAQTRLNGLIITELFIEITPKLWGLNTENLKISLKPSQVVALFIMLTKYDNSPLLLQLKNELHKTILA